MTDTSATPESLRLNNIQALRGIAALLVVFSHLWKIEEKYSPLPLLNNNFNFGMLGVDLFFLISGFIMVYITAKTAFGAKSVGRFLFSRTTRIYPLYWVVTLAVLGLYLIYPDMVFSSAVAEPDIVKSFLLWPDKTFPLLQLGWTLIHEMGFYLIFGLLLFFPSRLRMWALIGWVICLGIGLYLNWNEINPVFNILFHPLSFEFLAGAFLAYIFLSIQRLPSWALFIIGALGVITSILFWTGTPSDLFNSRWSRVLYFTAPLSALLLGAVYLERVGKLAPKALIKLGDWSYSLYLTHLLTLSLIGKLWAPFEQPGIWDNMVMLWIMLLASILIAFFTYSIIEKPCINYSQTLRHKWFG